MLKPADVPKDYIIIYLLGQVCHNQYDLDLTLIESPVGFGNFHSTFKLLFEDCCAKGFYILKTSGCDLLPFFPIVDFLYIRKKYRNKGLGKMMLLAILNEHAGADLYFSVPLSFSLRKILSSVLRINQSLKNILWGVDGKDRFSIYYYLASERLQAIRNGALVTC